MYCASESEVHSFLHKADKRDLIRAFPKPKGVVRCQTYPTGTTGTIVFCCAVGCTIEFQSSNMPFCTATSDDDSEDDEGQVQTTGTGTGLLPQSQELREG